MRLKVFVAWIFSMPPDALRINGLVTPHRIDDIKTKINCIW
jgi:hypothetical protein